MGEDTCVFSPAELFGLHSKMRSDSELPQRFTQKVFLEFLVGVHELKEILLESPYGLLRRYAWGDVSTYLIALALQKNSYLSHGTAACLHGLTDRKTCRIYVNKEQSMKPRSQSLTQHAIDAAFSRKQRTSNYVVRYEESEIVLISGKNTGRLGVERTGGPGRRKLDVTCLERTLIDLAVRPAYAGGVGLVLQCFSAARERVDVAELVAMLSKLDYVYPYHQAIGFYMQKAGYADEQLTGLRAKGFSHDFYLAHNMENREYNSDWRIFTPPGLDSPLQSSTLDVSPSTEPPRQRGL